MDERELIERVWKFLRRDPYELLGFDDAQAAELKGKIVANLDVFDEVTDWLPGMTLCDVGWKSVVMGVSDVLVKGAKPLGVMLGLGLPEELLDFVDDLLIGIREACDDLSIHLWGGDTGA
ncbi:MAG: AIR synthase related protein, partial [Thermofilaceae archaeon]